MKKCAPRASNGPKQLSSGWVLARKRLEPFVWTAEHGPCSAHCVAELLGPYLNLTGGSGKTLDANGNIQFGDCYLERETGVEPATSSLARKHSTTELLPLLQN